MLNKSKYGIIFHGDIMETGILYVVYNNWIRDPETNEIPFKIGITRGTVYDRYYGLGLKMPGKFETLFAYQLEDCVKAEHYIHGILNKYRKNGEWFNINQKELDLIKANCEAMDGIIVTDEVIKEIETETNENINFSDENTNNSIIKTGEKTFLRAENPINPNKSCKIFIFSIGNAISGGKNEYDATRRWWRITENYRNFSEYEFAVGLKNGISLGAYKINKWVYNQEYDKCEFKGVEINDFKGYSWYKQINVGCWKFGSHLVAEFDGNGKFKLLRPNKPNWIDCV